MKTQLHSPIAMVRLARALTRFLPTPAIRWAALVALAALTFGPQPTQAAVTEAWVHRYSNVVSNSVDQAFKVVSDAAGDIIVTGTSDNGTTGTDILTIKYSGTDGSMLWQRRYNGPANGNDSVSGMALDGSGNVVVVGTSPDGGSMQGGEYYTAKYAAADGAILWEKRGPRVVVWYPDSVLPALVAMDSSGNVVVAMPAFNQDGIDSYTAKYAAGNGALLWEKRYDSPSHGYDWLNSLAVDGSGNVFVAGRSNGVNPSPDYYTVKYSADGNLLWETLSTQPDNSDPFSIVAVDGSGNLVAVGTFYNGNNSDFQTTKYAAADGALLWTKRYNGSANRNDSPTAVAVDSNGNVVVTGLANRGGLRGEDDVYTAKYAAADGSLLWEKLEKRTGEGDSYTQAVAVDVNGNVIVTGSSSYIYHTAKYGASDGALLWEKSFDGPGKYYASYGPTSIYYNYGPASIATDAKGNVILTGTLGNAYYTAKYGAADGTLLWEQSQRGPANRNDRATGVAVDAGGNVVVTGVSENENGAHSYTAKYAAPDGTLIWFQLYHGPIESAYDFSDAVALDASGNVVVAGSYKYYGIGSSTVYCYTAKYATADGTLLWEQRYKSPGDSGVSGVAIDGSGNAVMTGYVRGSDFRADYYTAKYAAADGAVLWEKHYNSPANGDDTPSALAVDSKGNVVVTGGSGSSYNAGALYNSYTVKYAAADGALLWEQRYNGAANINGQAYAVAVDGSGNVVVTGRSSTSISGEDGLIYTAKYAAEDGVLLWEKSYKGPGKGYERAFAIAVDFTGNAVVTGYSQGDFYTAKYAGADGALLWERRGPVGYASAVRVTGSGDVVVTGNSYTAGISDDYYTAKYASADGALLWEKRYNGPANKDDYVTAMAIGPDGRVAITGSSDGNFKGDSFFDYATVVYREALSAISIHPAPSGIRLTFAGTAGQSYTVQRAPAVTGPWNTISTQTAPASGLIQYEDVARTQGAGFYRTSQP